MKCEDEVDDDDEENDDTDEEEYVFEEIESDEEEYVFEETEFGTDGVEFGGDKDEIADQGFVDDGNDDDESSLKCLGKANLFISHFCSINLVIQFSLQCGNRRNAL